MDSGLSARAERTLNAETADVTPDDVARALDHQGPIMKKVLGSRHLAVFFKDVELLFEMIRDHLAKRYTTVPWHTVAATAATLLYILNPFDIIPDFIPGLGYVDDGMVVMLAMKMVGKDLEKYKLWRRSQG
jgi:uncharacterized membrane protein YkvA (DUF1232 family)